VRRDPLDAAGRGHGAEHRTEGWQAGGAQRAIRQRRSPTVDITDRNVVVASVARERVAAPGCQRIEITSSNAGPFATFVGLTDPTTGREQRTGFPTRTCALRSSAYSRPDRTCPAGPERFGGHRHPVPPPRQRL